MATKKTSKKTRTSGTAKRAGRKTASRRGAKSARKSPVATTYEGSGDGDGARGNGASSLVIVESPAKARTISKYLGRNYKVRATVGHIMDLPPKKLGIDVDNGFELMLVPIEGKEKTIAELKSAARDASEVLVATDPDREGEAIAWHVAEQVRRSSTPIKRVLFH
jgi:DNA topoisomerase-1